MSNCPYPAMLKSKRYHCRHDGELQSEYGPQMTCDVYWTQFYAQGGACGACLRPWQGTPGASRSENAENRLSVDHGHVTVTNGKYGADGPFRGLLCKGCNRLLTEGVIEKILRHVDEDVITLSGGDVVTASQVAFVRNPPAAGLGVWITGRRRPLEKKKRQPSSDDITLYRTHLRVTLNPARWPCCPADCAYGHPLLDRPRVPVVPVVRAPVAPRPKPEPVDVVSVYPLGTRVLQVAGGTLGVLLLAAVVWVLLPVLLTLAFLAVTGLIAARTLVPS